MGAAPRRQFSGLTVARPLQFEVIMTSTNRPRAARLLRSSLALLIAFIAALPATGCGTACPAIACVPAVNAELRVPTADPATLRVTVCHEGTCRSGTASAGSGGVQNVDFESTTAGPLASAVFTYADDTTRLLQVTWYDVAATDGQRYSVTVTDAAGATVAALDAPVVFQRGPATECGPGCPRATLGR